MLPAGGVRGRYGRASETSAALLRSSRHRRGGPSRCVPRPVACVFLLLCASASLLFYSFAWTRLPDPPKAAQEAPRTPQASPPPFIHVYETFPASLSSGLADVNPACARGAFSAERTLHLYLSRGGGGGERFVERDASAAGLFFVPLYSSCALTRKDVPAPGGNPHRLQAAAVEEAAAWLAGREEWRRRGGHDHVFALAHDFGACLSHRDFGRGPAAPVLRSAVVAANLGDYGGSCYAPHKDVVLPPPSALSPAPPGPRPPLLLPPRGARLVFFRGTAEWVWAGRPDPGYSRGVRQALRAEYGSGAYPGVLFVEGAAADPAAYAAELAAATFCLCPLGYATWSPRLSDAVLSGCVPIVVADRTHLPLRRQLRWEEFSVRLDEAEAVRPGAVADAAAAVSDARLEAMRRRLAEPALRRMFDYGDGEGGEDCGACEAAVRELWEVAKGVPDW